MRVTAKQWVLYHGTWHQAGETFEVNEADLAGMAETVDAVGEPVSEPQPAEPATAEQPKPKRARKK